MTLPPLASITILKAAISMTVVAIHCEHIGLDELPRYYEDRETPPKSLVLAQSICDHANDFLYTLDAYWKEYRTEIEAMKRAEAFPF